MEQIVDYKNDPGNGYTKTLLCFVQIFIVSNRTDTWYFVNNNARHFAFDADERFLPICQFAAEDNTKITHLDDFADRFFDKCTLGQMISKHMVLIASEQKLLMMRPYQIYAVKAIVDCIDQNCGNGYIWHTTGSGKTLTSFKASTLLKTNDSIHKCLFVVDRKDLDRQTREEFNRFQENCVEENTNTAALVRRLLSDDYADKVIVTTIQKLGLALDENSKHNKQNLAQGRSTFKQRLGQLRDKRMVFIFDECHRSQFGENHRAINEFFPNSQLFGFTGTPIFEDNATVKQIEGDVATLRTTKDLFQMELHAYTITHAIEDRNVLRFHVDYYKPKDAPALKPGEILAKQAVAQAILDKHDAATGGRRFNALLATASINAAIEYYEGLQEAPGRTPGRRPRVRPPQGRRRLLAACGGQQGRPADPGGPSLRRRRTTSTTPRARRPRSGPSSPTTTSGTARTTTSTTSTSITRTSSNASRTSSSPIATCPTRAPRRSTSPSSSTCSSPASTPCTSTRSTSTRSLKHHGLIQAFSRTNRVLNATKPYGHILDFRQQQDSVDAAIALFSGAEADRAREIWLVDKAPVVIDNFKQAVADLGEFMQSQGLEAKPDQVNNLMGDDARAQFIKRFKEVQRLQTAARPVHRPQLTSSASRLSRSSPRTTAAPSAAPISKPPSASRSSRARLEKTPSPPTPRSTSSTSSSSSSPPPSSTTTTS